MECSRIQCSGATISLINWSSGPCARFLGMVLWVPLHQHWADQGQSEPWDHSAPWVTGRCRQTGEQDAACWALRPRWEVCDLLTEPSSCCDFIGKDTWVGTHLSSQAYPDNWTQQAESSITWPCYYERDSFTSMVQSPHTPNWMPSIFAASDGFYHCSAAGIPLLSTSCLQPGFGSSLAAPCKMSRRKVSSRWGSGRASLLLAGAGFRPVRLEKQPVLLTFSSQPCWTRNQSWPSLAQTPTPPPSVSFGT